MEITGEFSNSLDDKGRLMIPSKLRAGVEGNILVLTRGVDKCLWLFPPEEWKRISDDLMKATSPFHARARMIQRRIIAPAQEIEVDKAGRIMIPPTLREYAGLQKECIILAIKKYIEVWDDEVYKSYWIENESEFQSASEEIGGLVSF